MAIQSAHFSGMETNPSKPAPLVFWIIWFAILNGLFLLQFLAAGGLPEGKNQGEAPVAVIASAAALAVFSMAIRFLAIPKAAKPTEILPLMVVGLAFAEGIGIIGMFFLDQKFPETRIALFVTSVSAVLTYAPFYVQAAVNRSRMR